MKKILTPAFLLAAFVLIFGCAENIFAQQARVPMVGGFKPMPAKSKEVVSAATFAVRSIAKAEEVNIQLSAVTKAEYQMVAGKKYRMSIETLFTTPNEEAFTMCLDAEVFLDLRRTYKLLKWQETECPEVD